MEWMRPGDHASHWRLTLAWRDPRVMAGAGMADIGAGPNAAKCWSRRARAFS
jgi:hypothetical protein